MATASRNHFDVVVCGAGPAGACSAFVLAEQGANVALVDKARFPRDKACGDLIGPRGVALIERLGLGVSPELVASDMLVMGPSGRQVRLPARRGRSYPGHGWSIARRRLDSLLVTEALNKGAQHLVARVSGITRDGAHIVVHLDGQGPLVADALVGADGATSAVAPSAGLLRATAASWGFALRTYVEADIDEPIIEVFDARPGAAFPGYAWLFPGPNGRANAGVGLSTGASRRNAAETSRQLDLALARFARRGLVDTARPLERPLGGWLRMGLSGTLCAADRVLLVGDAAGLVNPLQGEGIAQALESGEMAARLLLDGPAQAAARYRLWTEHRFGGFQRPALAVQSHLIARPRALSRLVRLLTSWPVAPVVAPAWGLYWNDLLDGALPGPGRRLAGAADTIARLGARSLGPPKSTSPKAPAREAVGLH